MAFLLKKTIVLVGMLGSGKTAVGTALAKRLGVYFRDSGAEIVLAANMTIAEVFERDGEEFFRQRETEVLSRLLEETPAVLSTGGGAFLAERNRKIISQKAISVWLKADLELLWSRVRHKDTRPLLRTSDPHATLARLCREREPLYAKADLCVTAQRAFSIEEMADSVTQVLLSRPDVLEKT